MSNRVRIILPDGRETNYDLYDSQYRDIKKLAEEIPEDVHKFMKLKRASE